jgi:hypothetical protein
MSSGEAKTKTNVCKECGIDHGSVKEDLFVPTLREKSNERKVEETKKQSKNLKNKDIFIKSDGAPVRRKIMLHGKKSNVYTRNQKQDRSVGPQVVSKGRANKNKQRRRKDSTESPNQLENRGILNNKIVKKCLLIGINYTGTGSKLNGCINDSENLKELLKKNRYFAENQITMMNDKKQGALKPTKANILRQFRELIKFANANKGKEVRLFVSYSGHGVGVKDHSNEESDGQDEALCPIDYERAGFIIDDDIRRNFVNKLPSNVKLVMLVDACHSATMLDLKYGYLVDNKNTYKVGGKILPTPCEVIALSGCRDNQTSADAWEHDPHQNKNEAQGAMTASFIASYRDGISYGELVGKIRTWLRNKRYAQVPQLTSGRLVDIDSAFMLGKYN